MKEAATSAGPTLPSRRPFNTAAHVVVGERYSHHKQQRERELIVPSIVIKVATFLPIEGARTC